MTSAIKVLIKHKASEYGFASAGFTGPEILQDEKQALRTWLSEKRHGTMDWMEKRERARTNPGEFFTETESILVVAYNYYREQEDFIFPNRSGTISIYARGRDYHKVLRKKLSKLLRWLQSEVEGAEGRIFVDSFPIMEKPLARRAGLGWIAKNTTLIIKGKGSFYFLGGILLNLPIPPDKPFSQEYCGSCTRCADACPTDALSAPFQIDARRCISYLTIEHEGEIAVNLRNKMGNHIFGCDICQTVCPWNRRYASDTLESDFSSRSTVDNLLLRRLAALSREEYEKMFEGTPVRRAGFEKFKRNVKTAIDNAGRNHSQ